MSDLLIQFIDAMRRDGCGPAQTSDIVADDKWHACALHGDKPKKKAGYYRLKIDGDFAVGNYGNRREGVTHSWHSQSSKRMSAEDRAALNKKLEAERAAKEKQASIDQSEAATRANNIWSTAKKITDPSVNAYLTRKQVGAHGIRISGDDLIIPMWADGKIQSIQKITPDGDKFFEKSGRVTGCHFGLAEPDESKDTILICEGFATGASLRESTGLPVICAFTANNLMPVSVTMREKYPTARIIICSDNDRFTTRQDGTQWNPGRDKGRDAASAIGAHEIWPEFPDDDKKSTDFNDLHNTTGLDLVRERIDSVPAKIPAQAVALTPDAPIGLIFPDSFDGGDYLNLVPDYSVEREPDDSWKSRMIWKYNNKGDQTTLDADKSINYGLMIQNELPGIFVWNEFTLTVLVRHCPPWTRPDKFRVHELSDNDILECDYWLQTKMLSGSLEKTRGGICRAALLNPIHPARDYFDKLVWDQIPRLDNWLIDICGAERDDPEYLRAVGSKWMIAAVKRVYLPGCQFDHMLLLEGKQGTYKSSTLRELATFGDDGAEEEYFTDSFSLLHHKNKDELAKMWGCLIVEIGEMAGFSNSDIEAVKNFITIRSDKFRIPYEKLPQTFPRQFVFAGTRNPRGGIFKDPTGSRRFWPVAVGNIDFEQLRRDKNQLWAEAVYRYKQGESLKLSDALYKKCEEAAAERKVVDDWSQDVMEAIGLREFVTVREVMQSMGIPLTNRTERESARIADILRSEGFEYKQKWVGRKRFSGWHKEPEQSVLIRKIGDEDDEV